MIRNIGDLRRARAKRALALKKKYAIKRFNLRAYRVQKGYTRTGGYYGRFGTGGETKFLDTSVAIGNVTNAFVEATNLITSLNVVPQGDTQSNRDGRKIVIKSLQMKLLINCGTAIADTFNSIRVMVILDTQANGASFLGSQILTLFTVNGMRNLENEHRFKILYDKSYNIEQVGVNTAATTQIQGIKLIKWYKKCNIPIDYDSTATTGALATIRSNNLALLYIPTSAADTMDVAGNFRIRYVG